MRTVQRTINIYIARKRNEELANKADVFWYWFFELLGVLFIYALLALILTASIPNGDILAHV